LSAAPKRVPAKDKAQKTAEVAAANAVLEAKQNLSPDEKPKRVRRKKDDLTPEQIQQREMIAMVTTKGCSMVANAIDMFVVKYAGLRAETPEVLAAQGDAIAYVLNTRMPIIMEKYGDLVNLALIYSISIGNRTLERMQEKADEKNKTKPPEKTEDTTTSVPKSDQ